MKNIWQKIRNWQNDKNPDTINGAVFSHMDSERTKKIEKGAKDFAKRFEDVMRELSNG